MKRLFLISSYCNTIEKKEVLRNNINLLRGLGYDTLLLSPIEIEEEYIKNSNFYFRTEENPVFSIETKTYIHWKIIENNNGHRYRLERFFPEYGWAALYQSKKLSQIGLTFDYDIYYHIIYDTKIDDRLINEIKSNNVNQYYSNKSTNGDINEFSLHFLPLDRKTINSFEKFLDRDKYVTSDDLTHDFLLKWSNQNNISKSNLIIEEYINYYTDINFFSIYNGNECEVFLEKFENDQEKNGIFCYNKKNHKISLVINRDNMYNNLKDMELTKTNFYTSDINKVEVIVDDKVYDCTENYTKIGRAKVMKI